LKLKVKIRVEKCPKCGSRLNFTVYEENGVKKVFYYCSNSRCRYARVEPL